MFKNLTVGIIAAISPTGVYSCEGKIPWYIPADLKNFKFITLGDGDESNVVIMGRITRETTPFLKGRINITVSSTSKDGDNNIVASSIEEAIEKARKINPNLKEVWLIGGKNIWEEGLKYADKAVITVADVEISDDKKDILKSESLIPRNLMKQFSLEEITSMDSDVPRYKIFRLKRK
jgi:dihydrofolate reductase